MRRRNGGQVGGLAVPDGEHEVGSDEQVQLAEVDLLQVVQLYSTITSMSSPVEDPEVAHGRARSACFAAAPSRPVFVGAWPRR
jgi:hypothetical protein